MKGLLTILLLAMIFVAACSSNVQDTTAPVEQEPTQVAQEENSNSRTTTRVVTSNTANKEDLGELRSSFTLEGVEYIASEANQYGDESATRRIAGTNLYTLHSAVEYGYSPSSSLSGKNVYFELRTLGLDEEQTNVVYEGTLEEGGETIEIDFIIQHTGASPKMDFCFDVRKPVDDENCIPFSTLPVSNELSVNTDLIRMDPGTTKNIILTNDGNAPITAFIQVPAGDEVELSASAKSVTLAGGETTIVGITASEGSGDVNEDHVANVYAIPDNCALSNTCGNGARIKNKIEIEVD